MTDTKINYFMSSSSEWDRLKGKFDYEQTKQSLVELGFQKGMSFLDVGCGPGMMVNLVSDFDKTNENICGIDANSEFMERATKESKEKGNNQIKYYTGNIYNLPFADDSFDFVWSRFLFEYLQNPILALKELRRVVKKGGIVAVGDLDGNDVFHYPIDVKLEDNLNKIMKALATTGFDPFVGRKLFYYMNEAGIEDVEVKLYPYHNIYGEPKSKDLENWVVKVNSCVEFLKKNKSLNEDEGEEIKKDFLNHFCDKKTFTYSMLIFAKGKK